MKILMVNKFLYPNGGAETYTFKLGKYLTNVGNEVQYFGMDDSRNIVGNKIGEYSPNVNYHESNGIFAKIKIAKSTIYSKKACRAIGKVLDDFKPDIVHMNNINFQLTPAIIYESKKRNIPIVQTVHDVQIACPCHRFYIEHENRTCKECEHGKFGRCIKNKCVQNSVFKSALATMESYYYHKRDIYNVVDLYICPSEFIANEIITAGVKKEKTIVMHNFSDGKKEVELNDNGEKYIIYFGRLSPEKGILTLLKACERLDTIKLVIAGTGPLEETISEQVKSKENIELVGFKEGDELNKLILNAAFSINPSECYENCPLSVVESGALGTPVIGSDLGGTKELINNNQDGVIFEAGNVDSLSEAIKRLWNDEQMVEQMSAKCLEKSENTIENYTDSLIGKYDEIRKDTNVK